MFRKFNYIAATYSESIQESKEEGTIAIALQFSKWRMAAAAAAVTVISLIDSC